MMVSAHKQCISMRTSSGSGVASGNILLRHQEGRVGAIILQCRNNVRLQLMYHMTFRMPIVSQSAIYRNILTLLA